MPAARAKRSRVGAACNPNMRCCLCNQLGPDVAQHSYRFAGIAMQAAFHPHCFQRFLAKHANAQPHNKAPETNA